MKRDEYKTGYNTGYWHVLLMISCSIILIGLINVLTNYVTYNYFIFGEIYIMLTIIAGGLLATAIARLLDKYKLFDEVIEND